MPIIVPGIDVALVAFLALSFNSPIHCHVSGRPELRLVVKYTSDFRRVEINRKLNNCTSEIMNKKAELGRIEQMETALEAARKAGTFNDVATAFHKQALLLAARHAEEKEAAKRHVFSHCDPEGCWNLHV